MIDYYFCLEQNCEQLSPWAYQISAILEFKPREMEFLHRELVFWGVEVQSGRARQVKIRDNILHLSQACLRVPKKNDASERVVLFVEIDKKKRVLGILSIENLPQQQFDLVFHTDFKLSHSWKNGSVFFYGYKTVFGHYLKIDSDESEPEEDNPLMIVNIGKKNAYYLNSDDSEDENDKKTSQEAEPSNKRAAETATETRVQNKKAKVATPQKTGDYLAFESHNKAKCAKKFNKCRMKMGLILTSTGDKVMRLWSAESCKGLDEYQLPDRAPLIDFDFDEGKSLHPTKVKNEMVQYAVA